MVDKYVVDDQKDDKQTIRELAAKINELVEVVVNPPVAPRARPAPTALDHLRFIETMLQRVQSGPCTFILQSAPSAEATAVQQSITASQESVRLLKVVLEAAQ